MWFSSNFLLRGGNQEKVYAGPPPPFATHPAEKAVPVEILYQDFF